jgi:hypothetical protein
MFIPEKWKDIGEKKKKKVEWWSYCTTRRVGKGGTER